MKYVDALYFKKNNRSTDIVYLNSNKTINKTIEKLLNELCLENLSTLNGRINAVKERYNIHKFIPIYISNELILLPIYPKDYYTQIYLNINLVKNIQQELNKTKIIFNEEKYIIVDAPYLRIKQYVEKCKRIKNDQLIKSQERIYITWQRKT